MKRVLWVLARTALLVLGGTVLMIGIGKLYGLTASTCSTICNPAVSGPLGAILGLILAVMIPSLKWKPLELED